MQPKVLKYLLDIESIISEIEIIKTSVGNDFSAFNDNVILKRAVERELEIIGLRNIISHAYDSVEPELIWGIIQRDIPKLSDEIQELRNT